MGMVVVHDYLEGTWLGTTALESCGCLLAAREVQKQGSDEGASETGTQMVHQAGGQASSESLTQGLPAVFPSDS